MACLESVKRKAPKFRIKPTCRKPILPVSIPTIIQSCISSTHVSLGCFATNAPPHDNDKPDKLERMVLVGQYCVTSPC